MAERPVPGTEPVCGAGRAVVGGSGEAGTVRWSGRGQSKDKSTDLRETGHFEMPLWETDETRPLGAMKRACSGHRQRRTQRKAGTREGRGTLSVHTRAGSGAAGRLCPRLTGRGGGAAGTPTDAPPKAGSKPTAPGPRLGHAHPGPCAGHRRRAGRCGRAEARPPRRLAAGTAAGRPVGGVKGTLLGAGPRGKQGLTRPQQTQAVPEAEAGVARVAGDSHGEPSSAGGRGRLADTCGRPGLLGGRVPARPRGDCVGLEFLVSASRVCRCLPQRACALAAAPHGAAGPPSRLRQASPALRGRSPLGPCATSQSTSVLSEKSPPCDSNSTGDKSLRRTVSSGLSPKGDNGHRSCNSSLTHVPRGPPRHAGRGGERSPLPRPGPSSEPAAPSRISRLLPSACTNTTSAHRTAREER